MGQQVSAGIAIVQDSLPHTANVVVHVFFGTCALILGLTQLLSSKGGPRHKRRGRWFLACVWVGIVTAATGLLLFRFGAFLTVITLLVAYWAYSGYRTLKIRETGPGLQDACASVIGIGSAVLFIVYLQSVRFPWAPAVIYSTLGTLVAVASYDLVRFAFPRAWFRTLWLYEHVVKMLGAYGAVVSAFSGTMFNAWQPYSQLVPSALGTAAMVGYVVYVRRRMSPAAEAILPDGPQHLTARSR